MSAVGVTKLRVAVLAPVSWRVPPRHYGPWEQFASLLTEGLAAKGGVHGGPPGVREAVCCLKRLEAGHKLDTVIGLSGVHFYLAGQRDFDTFMRQSAQGTVHVIAGAAWTREVAGLLPKL